MLPRRSDARRRARIPEIQVGLGDNRHLHSRQRNRPPLNHQQRLLLRGVRELRAPGRGGSRVQRRRCCGSALKIPAIRKDPNVLAQEPMIKKARSQSY